MWWYFLLGYSCGQQGCMVHWWHESPDHIINMKTTDNGPIHVLSFYFFFIDIFQNKILVKQIAVRQKTVLMTPSIYSSFQSLDFIPPVFCLTSFFIILCVTCVDFAISLLQATCDSHWWNFFELINLFFCENFCYNIIIYQLIFDQVRALKYCIPTGPFDFL